MKRYPAYKDSGVEWIGEIPDHWIAMKFKLSKGNECGQCLAPDEL